ncbi:MAG: MaoC/PaaZ C-terminal domain-containing protein [Propionibacteriaceae bacterium]|nr:MaoC/PaaZ C-terminal domain-containing protein [Propionibacteriaceae bacterium]
MTDHPDGGPRTPEQGEGSDGHLDQRPELIDLPAPPTPARELLRGTLRTPLRGRADNLPATALRLRRTEIDRGNLLAYQQLTGFAVNDVLPPAYPHLLGFPLQAKLLGAADFPLPLAGLVHIDNEITQLRPLYADDYPDVTVHAANLRPHPKGTAVDLITEVHLIGTLAWSSRSTYLHRGHGDNVADPGPTPPAPPTTPPSARWRLPADLGRQYAALSGDVNPIHLHPWTARALGFPRAIAHGMWSFARTLAAFGRDLPIQHASRVWFRKPILLPRTVAFVREPGSQIATVVDIKDRDRIHLLVEIS